MPEISPLTYQLVATFAQGVAIGTLIFIVILFIYSAATSIIRDL